MNQEPYTTIESVCGYLGIEVPSESSDEYAHFEAWILAMSMWIDKYTNRTIYRTEESTIKYDGDGSDLMVINDVIDPVVTVDGESREVFTYPTNKPYASRIALDDGWKFTRGRQNIHVTGVHAMAIYLPDDVQQACNVLVAGIYNAKNVQGKVGTSETIGSYSVTYRDAAQKTDFDNAKAILSGYRRIAL